MPLLYVFNEEKVLRVVSEFSQEIIKARGPTVPPKVKVHQGTACASPTQVSPERRLLYRNQLLLDAVKTRLTVTELKVRVCPLEIGAVAESLCRRRRSRIVACPVVATA